jgi:hypothetical protein
VTTNTPPSRLALIATLVVIAILAAVPAALADKGGHGGKSAPVSSTGSLSLATVDSADGTAHWGQQVGFNVTSTAAYNDVTVMCYQGGNWVYGSSKAAGSSFVLQSSAWTGGAADCTAELWESTSSGGYVQALGTTSFRVNS